MVQRHYYAPVTKATHDEARQMDLEDARHRVDQDFPTGRLANFASGHGDARPDIQPGTQPDYWANKRYGDRSQIPSQGPRRAGPLPYPETEDDYYDAKEDLRRSHAE